jgi:alpha-tubulin suppressor-like RCC1 family protein
MRIDVKSIILVFLMLALSLSVATNSLNGEVENPTFEETAEPLNVILPIADLNVPGHQEGSIFSDTTLSSGSFRTCALLDDGTVSCWGTNTYGQLGDGTNSARSTPTQTSSLGTGRIAVAISAGNSHTCAILDDGTVSCWGRNNYGQLGDGTTTNRNTPNQTSSLGVGRTAVAISSGSYHTCAILDDGTVSCWGDNYGHQLGDGTFFGSYRNIPNQTSSLGTGRTAVAISAGNSHTCAILDDASVSCWGDNYYGQLGDGTNSGSYTPTQTSSLGIGRIPVAISSGVMHTCAILDDASVSCWGRNNFGQLGDGTYTDRNTPTQTSSLGIGRIAVAISSGYYHTCAVLDNASVSCWGYNNDGGLGDGTNSNRSTPTQTSSLGVGRTAVAISSGNRHTCALLDDASVSCWGRNSGNLGDGTTIDRNTPTQTSSLGVNRTVALSERDFDNDGILNIFDVHQILDVRESSISSGGSHTCALLNNGTVSCWGRNNFGQLGDGTTTDRGTPTQTSSLGTGRTAIAISSGTFHSCALLDNGSVLCWGSNWNGQLGDGTTTHRNSPTLTSSFGVGRTAIAISAKGSHTCALLDDGSVTCWGYNEQGQLGDGTNIDRNIPTPISSLGTGRTAVTISSGVFHSCAILDDDSVSCWGSNSNGQLGDGTTTNRNIPTQISSFGIGINALAISSGTFHTCAILDNGSVTCWGYNNLGQLGDGTTTDRNIPTQTSNFGTGRTAVVISTGRFHTCAILDNGSVSCWGKNAEGQLGDETTTNRNSPTLTSNLGTDRTAVAITNDNHNCAVLDNSTLSCWGTNNYGQLGDGTTTNQNSPTQTSSFGTNQMVLLVDGDTDGDGTLDYMDDFPDNSIRSIACMSGQYGRYVCIDAPLGKYSPSNSSMYAIDSPAGHYVNQTGQSSAIACFAGTYNVNTGSSSSSDCISADAGYYVGQNAQSNQTECGLGTYQALTGQSSCDESNAGHYVGQVAQTNQTECGLGTYQPLTGQISCDNADAGYYVDQMAQANQTECGLGTYQPLIGQSSCDNADAGYYVGLMAQTTQTECDLGTYQPLTGQSSCDDVDAGYYVNQMAQANQIECGLGTYQPLTGQSSCDDADTGYYVDQMAQANQIECGLGTYQPLTGQSSCDDADAGYYVDQIAQVNQIECGLGTYQPLTGQSSCDDADAGYYVNQIAQTNQTECGLGTYQPLTGQSSCDDADAGYYVNQMAQTNQTECGLGTYQPLTGQSSCDDADAGYYVNQMAQTNQTECGLGTYQSLTGQNLCDDANAGYYVDQNAQTNQTECSLGTYQSLTGQSSCDDADAGYYVDQTSQTNQTECGLGTYQPLTGQSSCDDADAGYYVNQMAQTNQTECDLGTYQSLTGQSSCNAADAGYYVNQMAQTNQTECGLGTYQSLNGQNSCDDADAGNYVELPGQTNQTACLAGTYNPITGSMDSSVCIPCPISTSTLSSGSQSIAACKLDTDLDGIPDIIDSDDDNDGTIDELDAFVLDESENTDTDGDGIGDNEQALLESKAAATSQRFMLLGGGIGVLLITLGAIFVLKRKGALPELIKEIPETEPTSTSIPPLQIVKLSPNPSPSIEESGVIGGDGYEWITFPPNSQTNFYRAPGDKEWILWEN